MSFITKKFLPVHYNLSRTKMLYSWLISNTWTHVPEWLTLSWIIINVQRGQFQPGTKRWRDFHAKKKFRRSFVALWRAVLKRKLWMEDLLSKLSRTTRIDTLPPLFCVSRSTKSAKSLCIGREDCSAVCYPTRPFCVGLTLWNRPHLRTYWKISFLIFGQQKLAATI